MPHRTTAPSTQSKRTLSRFIFLSRWLQAPLYFGLIVAQGVYVYRFMVELWHLGLSITTITESAIMLMVLGLIDVVMIANLLVMVIVGGYETFVSRLNLKGHPDEPEWLSHVNAGVLKVKLATALIGISSIHLLSTIQRTAKVHRQQRHPSRRTQPPECHGAEDRPGRPCGRGAARRGSLPEYPRHHADEHRRRQERPQLYQVSEYPLELPNLRREQGASD